jgi:hypothetical protein
VDNSQSESSELSTAWQSSGEYDTGMVEDSGDFNILLNGFSAEVLLSIAIKAFGAEI